MNHIKIQIEHLAVLLCLNPQSQISLYLLNHNTSLWCLSILSWSSNHHQNPPNHFDCFKGKSKGMGHTKVWGSNEIIELNIRTKYKYYLRNL